MIYFEEKDGQLIFRGDGETVLITPWGANSFRVRAAYLGEIDPGSVALQEPEMAGEPVNIEIGELNAVITNGKLVAELDIHKPTGRLRITFKNQRGELLLREINNSFVLQKKRPCRPLP